MTQCLLVDDDAGLGRLLQEYLPGFGIHTDAVTDGAGMRRALDRGQYDVMLLDLQLPDADGLALCQWIKSTSSIPVIIVSGQVDPSSRVAGLELGADDYLCKPFDPRELVARIRAVVRRDAVRTANDAPLNVRFSGWTFDPLRRELSAEDVSPLILSSAEYRLLSAFVRFPGQVLSRDRLLRLTRAPSVSVDDRSIDLAVSRLRQKLGESPDQPQLLRTIRGAGYLFDTEVEACM